MVNPLKKNLYLFQPQYTVDYRTEKNYWIPYSIGCVWNYSSQFTDIQDNIDCKDIFFKRPKNLSLSSLLSTFGGNTCI